MFEWFFEDEKDNPLLSSKATKSKDDKIKFEILSSDETFLDSALSLTEMSPLDACYNIIIYNLKKKCGELTEEELGKLSVQLLNCQLEVEERPVFLCTNSMTLADCTKSMDGTSWNSYQIVGNRARAMCYATQQVQFRRLTELTVSHLVSAATDQIKSLNDLKLGQEQLHSITSETVRKLYESQQDLLTTQIALKEAHEDVFKHIATNVKEILQEKALIASGNKELVALTENIKTKLDMTAKKVQEREDNIHQQHEKILLNLKNIKDSTEVVQNLDNNLQELLKKYEKLYIQYESMYNNLEKMNATINHVLVDISTFVQHFDVKMSWLLEFLGVTENKLSAISCCLLHIAYFFLLAVMATLLEISVSVRLVMLVIIVGNVAAELNYNYSMNFAGLTVFLSILFLGFKLVAYMRSRFPVHLSKARGSSANFLSLTNNYSQPLTVQELNTMIDLLKRFFETVPPVNGSVVHDTSSRPVTPPRSQDLVTERLHTIIPPRNDIETSYNLDNTVLEGFELRHRLVDQLGFPSRRSSRSSTPLPAHSRSSTPSSRCLGSTSSGSQCRNYASRDSDFCYLHFQS
ncbi:hypothetical protein Btru_056524 [Bulinus truncatus]|nr:hypothetical protein Btru_056524 [Bulinus truncatus]